MKRFIVITVLFSVSILAVWAIFEASAASPPETKSDNTSIQVHDQTDEMLKASHSVGLPVPATGADMKIAPVFDSTGAIVSDPTGTMLDETDERLKASHSVGLPVPATGADMKIAPVFDSTGAVVSDPTGTMLNANHSGDLAVPLTGTDMKVAPVFDKTGAIVSDPTGTLLSVNNP